MKLRPHQEKIAEFVRSHKRGIIISGMGSGKTAALLHSVEHFPVLIIAPKLVAEVTWPAEIAKWGLPYSVKVVKGKRAQKYTDITCCSYSQLHNLQADEFKTVVVDECHKLRNPSSKQSKAVYKIGLAIDHCYGLTGTPTPVGLQDLYGQYLLIDKGARLGATFTRFSYQYLIDGSRDRKYHIWKPRPGAKELVAQLVSDVTIKIDVDLSQLPELVVKDIPVYMPVGARRLYQRVWDEAMLDESPLFSISERIQKAMQIAQGFYYDTESNVQRVHDAKAAALRDVLDAHEGQNILVSYTFEADKRYLCDELGAELLCNASQIEKWNRGEIKLAAVHPQSIGHGVNLQDGGHILVFYTLTYALDLYEQIIERIGPMRQWQSQTGKTPIVYRLITDKTIDVHLARILDSKADFQTEMMRLLKRN